MLQHDLTYLQHLNWSIGGRHFGDRLTDSEDFTVTVGKTWAGSSSSFAVEFNLALRHLLDTHGTKLSLAYSGGSDSELVLRELVRIGVRPDVFTVEFTDGSNYHETKNASLLCSNLRVKHHIYKHDMSDYIRGKKYLDLALKYKCSQLAYLTVLEYARLQDRPVVLGGEVYVQKHQHDDGLVHSSDAWHYVYREDEDACTYRYTRDTGHPIINEVFSYTPELLHSYLKHPVIKATVNNQVPGKITLLSMKKLVYEEYLGSPLLAQSKYTGYETLPWTNRQVALELKDLLPRQRTAYIEYQTLMDRLEGKI